MINILNTKKIFSSKKVVLEVKVNLAKVNPVKVNLVLRRNLVKIFR